MAGYVQRGDRILALDVHRRSALEEEARHVVVSVLGGEVEGGEAFARQRFLVCLMIEQNRDHVLSVLLGCDVETRVVVARRGVWVRVRVEEDGS